MTELIVGLSGHIDHGKTSIIKSLTNEFSGTLKEDESRGMTVDLGIAFLNDNITLIDVPGHQDFIKNQISKNSINHLQIQVRKVRLLSPQHPRYYTSS